MSSRSTEGKYWPRARPALSSRPQLSSRDELKSSLSSSELGYSDIWREFFQETARVRNNSLPDSEISRQINFDVFAFCFGENPRNKSRPAFAAPSFLSSISGSLISSDCGGNLRCGCPKLAPS